MTPEEFLQKNPAFYRCDAGGRRGNLSGTGATLCRKILFPLKILPGLYIEKKMEAFTITDGDRSWI